MRLSKTMSDSFADKEQRILKLRSDLVCRDASNRLLLTTRCL